MHYLTIENANKSFGDKVLFQDVSLMINKGEKIALIAPNGSGKSTLLRMIAGIEKPEGENAKYLVAKDITIAFLDQDHRFLRRGQHDGGTRDLNPHDLAFP